MRSYLAYKFFIILLKRRALNIERLILLRKRSLKSIRVITYYSYSEKKARLLLKKLY